MATAMFTVDGSEVILREAKPAFEWLMGRAVRKMSPKTRHSLLQGGVTAWLATWAAGRGLVGPEWRFRLAPAGEIRRPLVPDVAFLSFERFGQLTSDEDREEPPVAPEIAVEILSRGDRRSYLLHKRDVYLACGARLLLISDPTKRTLETFDVTGAQATFGENDVFTTAQFPDLRLELATVFACLDYDRNSGTE